MDHNLLNTIKIISLKNERRHVSSLVIAIQFIFLMFNTHASLAAVSKFASTSSRKKIIKIPKRRVYMWWDKQKKMRCHFNDAFDRLLHPHFSNHTQVYRRGLGGLSHLTKNFYIVKSSRIRVQWRKKNRLTLQCQYVCTCTLIFGDDILLYCQ